MFDKFVSDKLRDHQSPVPPGLWEKIERNKGKEPKAGVIPRTALWAGLMIIAAGTGIGVYLGSKKENNNLSQVNKTSTAVTSGSNQNKTGANATGNDNITSTDNNTTTNDDADLVNADQPNIDDQSTANDKTQTVDLPLAGKQQSADNAAPGTNNEDNNGDHPTVNNNTVGGNSTTRVSNSRTFATTKNRKSGGSKNFTLAAIDNDGLDAAPVLLSSHRISMTKRSTVYNLRSLAKNDVSGQYNLSDLSITRIDCPPNGSERRNDWYLEVFGSPDLLMKSVSGGNASFVSKKDSTESQQLSYTAGFRISKSIGENLLLKTGLQFSQINERFEMRTENERRIITVVTIRTIPGFNGADSTIRDTSTVEQLGYRLQRTYNRYRSIDIPVLLSYEFGGENLRFAINAGAIFNLRSWYSGHTLNDSMMVVSMDSKTAGEYKQNIGLAAYGGFSIMKPIGSKWDIFAEPYFRYNFSNMSRSDGYSQRFQAFGINLGLRYKFKGQRSGLK